MNLWLEINVVYTTRTSLMSRQEYVFNFGVSACVLSVNVSYTLLSIIEEILRIYMNLLLLLILLVMLIVMNEIV